ncbi:MAG TPA: RNA pseudouridine synthase [Virgibacillus sp.]|jgi:23S rRNA pseudouridine1911/1915/1917 synthase|nr:RNA pseudouridine synthase [Virgibacillus sp.]
MDIPIIYEDNHLLVVEKPVNIPVQEDRSGDQDLLTILKEDIKIRYEKPGNVYLGLVHRLDRPVGGVMVFAKTSKAAARLSDMMRRRVFGREYIAVVRGTPPQKNGRLEHFLVKDRVKNIVHTSTAAHKQANKAILEYETLGQAEGFSLLKVKLHTGRSHQIRVQLAAVDCPLYGDQKYGQKVNKPGQQIALWSNMIQFNHPVQKEDVSYQSTPPRSFPWNLWEESQYL